jgi:hypothetical protein
MTESPNLERELQDTISLFTALELPWHLPIQEITEPRNRSTKGIELCDTLSRPVQKVGFAPIPLNGDVRFEISRNSRMSLLQFAADSRKFPLLDSSISLSADIPLALEQKPWRLRQPAEPCGFPATGCYSFDFLCQGTFTSPSGRALSRRFTVRNHSAKTSLISLTINQEWLAIDPPQFHLTPKKSTDVVLRLLPERLSTGQNEATLKLSWQSGRIKIPVSVPATRAEAPAVLITREITLPTAGLGKHTDIVLQLQRQQKVELRGAIADPLHQIRIPFKISGDAGPLKLRMTLPTDGLFRADRSEWPLYVLLDANGLISTQKVVVRLHRTLQFDPPVAIVGGREPALVRVKEVAKNFELRIGDVPPNLEAKVKDDLVSIRLKSASGAKFIEWIPILDASSTERADLAILYRGDKS